MPSGAVFPPHSSLGRELAKRRPMTLMQAFKVWWSYSWRASLLVIPLGIIMTAWSLFGLFSALGDASLSGISLSGQGRPNLDLSNLNVNQLTHLLSGGVTLWVVSLVLTAAIQVFAMRWTLNSRWSDFRLKAVPPDDEVSARLPSRPGT
jgi:hypothetical protein